MNNHIAVDIGASSGRLVVGSYSNGTISLKEIHRFHNGFTKRGGSYFWNIDHLFNEIIEGLQKAKADGIESCTLGIDTWAVDYVLLDENDERISEVYAYRDNRTDHAMDEVAKNISLDEIYKKTGIQHLSFNTLYQLFTHNKTELSRAKQILFVPDYLYFKLTGHKINEVTNASTSQLLNLETQDYDHELLELLNLKREQFAQLTQAGTVIGPLREGLIEQYNLPQCELICVATHDTASAVLGAPILQDRPTAYISSGTWSLLGVEQMKPLNTLEALTANYTNEWGAYGTYRFLKNIMGLWLIQEVSRAYQHQYSFADFATMASEAEGFRSLIPCNHPRFLNPANMVMEIQQYCKESAQPIPETPGQLARCIFDSLALSYRAYLQELEKLTGNKIEVLQIVGGGVNNQLLCQITADLIEFDVYAGPTESTALGNLAVQMISTKQLRDIDHARRVIAKSFDIAVYHPRAISGLPELLDRFAALQ
ncbi:Rhamnulokinase [compost metagenome]